MGLVVSKLSDSVKVDNFLCQLAKYMVTVLYGVVCITHSHTGGKPVSYTHLTLPTIYSV